MAAMLLQAAMAGLLLSLPLGISAASSRENVEFAFTGFGRAKLKLTFDGMATVTSDGLLMLTDNSKQARGHAFYPFPIHFRNQSDDKIFSFSTTFVFGIVTMFANLGGHGIAFLVSPSKNFSAAYGSEHLGLFGTNDGDSSNHVFAVELDTIQNSQLFGDIDDNHVGIDLNGLKSNVSSTAGYYADDTGLFHNLSLVGGEAMQVWVDYDGGDMRINVTLAPIRTQKPRKPLISVSINLSGVFCATDRPMYVGFSSSSGSMKTAHYLLGWSFKMNGGAAQSFDYDSLPLLPNPRRRGLKVFEIVLLIASAAAALIVVGGVVFAAWWRMKHAEVCEDWELEFGPHRFSYDDLCRATDGFKDKALLGVGGFGRVYKGVLPSSKSEVAVKRVSHESRQGMREFIAEVVSLGQLRHRNLVQLLGYCRRKGELILVYDYMPNGSLDKVLYDKSKPALGWAARFRIIKGLASGLLYLHEDWEQVVVHRDIKASNVLLDGDLNGRLSDFGLARLYDHGTDPQTTGAAGTIGYIAPELARTGRATTVTDVFAFGVFMLEVACGRRPVDSDGADTERTVLLDWVVESWRKGRVLATRDPRLGEDYAAEEMEMVLTLGLLCSHPLPAARPSMRQVVQILEGDAPLPELSPVYLSFGVVAMLNNEGFGDYVVSYPSLPSVSTASAISGCR